MRDLLWTSPRICYRLLPSLLKMLFHGFCYRVRLSERASLCYLNTCTHHFVVHCDAGLRWGDRLLLGQLMRVPAQSLRHCICQQRRQEAFSLRASPKPSEKKRPVIVVSELSEVAIHFMRGFLKHTGQLQEILQPHRHIILLLLHDQGNS